MYSCLCYSLLLSLLFASLSTTEQIPFEHIISFGDSNTDTGNVYKLTNRTWPIVPPYFQGRFSNGLLWIEKLGDLDLRNYAYGGATTDNNLTQGYTASGTVPVPGVRQQILIYLNETNRVKKDFARRLYIIWVGGNDYFFDSTIKPATVTIRILLAVKDLLSMGAKHVLIVNQSPMQRMPFVRTEEEIVHYRKQTIYHNNNLSIGIQTLPYNRQEVSLYLFDMYSFLLKMMSDHSHNLSNAKDNCWNVSNGQVTVICSNPESYVYIDQYHFTARAHELIGNGVRQFLAGFSGSTKTSYSIGIISCALFLLFAF